MPPPTAAHRLTSVTFNGKELVRYDYNGYGDLTAVYGRDGKKLRGFAYRNHIMVEHNQPDGLVSRYEYDRYDTDGKVLKSSNNLGEEWTFDYRKDHTVVTDALGRTEVYGFDENRELIYRIDADGQRSDSERDSYGRITVERDLLGRETRYLYDTEGNVIAITAPDGSSTQIDYHETLNLPVAVNDPAGRITAYTYDGRGNLVSITDPAGYTTSYGYNAQWLPETITDALGKTRRLQYDTLDRLVCFTDCTGETTRFGYTEYGDLENQLVRAEIKEPAGNTEIWTYAYDPFGRRLSKERQDKLAWTSTEPKRTHFVWDGTRLLQEYTYKGNYTYIYTDQDSYEPLAQVFRNNQDEEQYLAYFHTDQVGIPREMTDIHGNLLWYGEYTAWGRLKKDERVYKNAHQPFRLQNQYFDEETGLHYNLMRYYEPEAGRFVNQDPIKLIGGDNLYQFAPNVQDWIDPLGLAAEGTLGTYGKLKGGGNQAHEFIRNKMLELMGETSAGKRLSENPSIAASHEHHQGRDNSNSIHKNEKRLAQKHLGLKSKNQFETSVCKRSGVKQGRIMPSKRQMDVWQGAIRMAGYGPSRARKLRKQAQRYLRSLGY